MLDVIATGYPSLDHIVPVSHSPGIGETGILGGVPDEGIMTYGGCGANVAVALARLGFRPGLAMVVGDDEHGRRYVQYLESEKIDTRATTLLAGERTSRSYLFRNPGGEYQNFFYPGAADAWNDDLSISDFPAARFALLTVGPLHYNRQFAQIMRKLEMPLIWQLKPDVFAYPPESLLEFVNASTLIIMNQLEATYLCQNLAIGSPRELVSEARKVVVVTKGQQGSVAHTESGSIEGPPARPDVVVDTTGAGDAFTAGFLAGLLRRYELQTNLHVGAMMAAFVLEAVGCQTNLPNWDELSERHAGIFGEL